MKSTQNSGQLKKAIVLGLSLVMGLGCSQKSTNEPLELISADLFSDRPTHLTNILVLLKLKTPSLIESATKDEDGNLIFADGALDAISAEQRKTIDEAKALSKDIKLVFTYKYVVNGVALSVPYDLYDAVAGLATVARADKETIFEQPTLAQIKNNKVALSQTLQSLTENEKTFPVTSVSHINATKVHNDLGLKGKGIKVGIIDSGIDFTHTMFGGSGDVNVYRDMDKEKATPLFPNDKVKGGYDFTGPDYSPGSDNPDKRVPRPDVNPIDEGGHGTHVAGTVAGLGDGVNTYDGVAPEADLYALKVFGGGGTSDTVVLAAMEYAMDPNGDGDTKDKLDVVNLSLGGGFGKPYILYTLAVQNLAKADIISVMSAGNSGPTPFITGAPGTSDAGLSVAASVDGMLKNWQFDSVAFTGPQGEKILSQRIEGSFTAPISENPVVGKLVFVGTAATDFDQETKDALNGNVAFIDRGGVSFVEKVTRAQNAGAVGVVVGNNQPGDAFIMGGDGSALIPGVMVTLDTATSLKGMIDQGDVTINFASDEVVKTPNLVDTITTFSSQGPRSEDGLIKPEIAAPGYQIISANMGTGTGGVAFNGTSMSAPHMAGVMALMKQAHKKASVQELKSIVMGTTSKMKDTNGAPVSITLQGAGLVDVYKAATTSIVSTPESLSLGTLQLEKVQYQRRVLTLKNLSEESKTVLVSFDTTSVPSGGKIGLREEKEVNLPAKSATEVPLTFILEGSEQNPLNFHEGFVTVKEKDSDEVLSTTPVLAVSKNLSRVSVTEAKVYASSKEESFNALVETKVVNKSTNKANVEFFNLLGKDDRKRFPQGESIFQSRSCDMQAAGYRVVEIEGEKVLQVGVKLFSPVSSWQACELSLLFDSNKDGEADYEVGGLPENYLAGLDQIVPAGFYSVLLDFPKAVDIRKTFDQTTIQNGGNPIGQLSFVPAIIDVKEMVKYDNSNLTILQVSMDTLNLNDSGSVDLKVTVFSEGGVEYEDGLQNKWFTISPQERDQAFDGLPTDLVLGANEEKVLSFTKGFGGEELMIVAPQNLHVDNTSTREDKGLIIPEIKYLD